MKKFTVMPCKKHIVVFLLSLFTISLNTYPQDLPVNSGMPGYPAATVPHTEVRSFYSNILDQEIILYMKLPGDYKKDTTRIYPCWYGTDANLAFPLVANMLGLFDVPVTVEPQVVLVGIAYKIRDMADWGAWRTRDLTPTNNPAADNYWSGVFSKVSGRQVEVRTGGAEIFYECIAKEVIPFVELNYRVSPNGRAIGGYSFGGLFSLYILFRHPEMFSLYFAGSPSIRYNNGILYTYEKEYDSFHNDLNATLFMSAGGLEDTAMVNNMYRMESLLKSRNYPGFNVTTQVFPGETHQTCVPAAFMRAFEVLYKK